MKNLFVNFDILQHNANFRAVFIARTISLIGLGMLAVALPKQVYDLTGDSLQVGIVMALDGVGMFVGLLYGGVLADRHDRKGLILLARSICGLGFFWLAVNAFLPQPSLWVIYVFALWDGFFGALGVTALLAAMPHIVGRENLMQARAVSMVSMRLAGVASPALGGWIIAVSDVAWNYVLAALGTAITLLPLLRLPRMQPPEFEPQHPLRELFDGVKFLFQNRIVGAVVIIGTLVTLTTAIRVLFPEMAESLFQDNPMALGLLYSAVPLGATLGALLSAWAERLEQPGKWMGLICCGVFGSVVAFGLVENLWLSLATLVVFGYLTCIASLLQYTLVQGHTPDEYLGRINGIWTAQDACGDSIGTVGIGLIGKVLSTAGSIVLLGAGALTLGLVTLGLCKQLRSAGLTDTALTDSASTA
ncbi:enterobactin transporter EntS [Teredinibacter turnerae]|uniref:enterobactin transporter EntS n=1 Tax=Teredinibacter turnerae TaxID=2426 RepID=UPI00036BF8D5|nr:enterobactin transporter EntS [Teredinibacter turnerae]